MTAALHTITEKKEAGMRLGSLEVRLAKTAKDIDDAQDLRYQVFYQDMGAQPSPEMAARARDFDKYDEFCDHLLLIDHSRTNKNPVIGTYRLIRREAAEKCGGFYSSSEYDVSRPDRLSGSNSGTGAFLHSPRISHRPRHAIAVARPWPLYRPA